MTENKPRNLMITDACSPLIFAFPGRFGNHHCLTIEQTADDETWPGGAVWDLGLLMAKLIAGLAGFTTTTVTSGSQTEKRSMRQTTHVAERCDRLNLIDCSIVLELGCGVGLTGLVAAAALDPKAVILTDLEVVVEKVTVPNVRANTVQKKHLRGVSSRTIHRGRSEIFAMPLCWGNCADEDAVSQVVDTIRVPAHSHGHQSCKKHRQKRLAEKSDDASKPEGSSKGIPDLILVGDVAYQHFPGAPSHFDSLVSSIRKLCDDRTLLMFGTRIRMPASQDLLDMLLKYFDPVIASISAEEIEPAFAKVKHNMKIHFLRKKVRSA